MEQKAFSIRALYRLFALAATLAGLVGCTPPEPIRLGFVGGISSRVADLGIGGRNGALLAVEMRNASGGVNGRQIELLVEDDQQLPEVAQKAVTRLIGRKVDAIVGPMTSAMAMATVPLVNQAQVLMVSPTVTTPLLTGQDDYFFRVIASTTEYAQKSAAYHFTVQGSRRIAAVLDMRNQSYSQPWLRDYQAAFEAAGGVISDTVSFSSGDDSRFSALVERVLHSRPDGVLILANSVDTALLAQQVRKHDGKVSIFTSEWAATERLLELGGKAIEGMVIAQFLDRASQQASYLAFHKAYLERFQHTPGFAGLTGFDAANVILDTLAARTDGQTTKQALLARQKFTGAQSVIQFDANGDARRDTFMTTIRDGAFVRLR